MPLANGVESPSRAHAEHLYERIADLVRGPTALMEVCGTHTVAISRFGLRSRLPGELRLISGPGCPVCVTPCEEIDRAIAMAREPGVSLVTFGDMLRVPGASTSLARERSEGRDVRVVYSPFEALEMARGEPRRIFVFFGIGFETTSPTVAATIVRARTEGTNNFHVLPAFKRVVPAMEALVAGKGTPIDGFLCPGHVSTVIGSEPYQRLTSERGVPCVVAGFEALDILEAIACLLEQKLEGRAEVEIAYRRAATREGNPTALALMERVLSICNASWRGIGAIPASGFELSEPFERIDARTRVPVQVEPAPDLPEGCACGEVMQGLLRPSECPLFGSACTPGNPVGPCMVTGEGACAAHYRYG